MTPATSQASLDTLSALCTSPPLQNVHNRQIHETHTAPVAAWGRGAEGDGEGLLIGVEFLLGNEDILKLQRWPHKSAKILENPLNYTLEMHKFYGT